MKQSLEHLEPFDQIGTGQAKVERVAATRRPVDANGQDLACVIAPAKSAALRALPEGAIDPYLKTITLARGQKPLVRLHYYATHPQTFYGDYRASSDMAGRRPRRTSAERGRVPDLLYGLRRRRDDGQV